MSTSDSAAGAPDFVALAETNRSIQNMNEGANNIFRDQRSAISSTPLPWNVIPTMFNPQVNPEAMIRRSRPPKRQRGQQRCRIIQISKKGS